MTIQVGVNGVANSYANDDVFNGFPNVTPALSQTGISSQDITLLETQKYTIDIFNDFQKYSPKEFPFLTILANVGGGVIDRNFDMWTSQYDGVDVIDIAIDELRTRDSAGDYRAAAFNTASNHPIPVGTTDATAGAEVGGKLFWQYCSVSPDDADYTWDFDDLADSTYLKLIAPTTKTTTLTEMLEVAPYAKSGSTKLIVPLAFSRTNDSANYLSDTRGRVSEVIGMLQNVLEVKDYTGTSYSGVEVDYTGTSTATQTVYEYKYTANSSHRVHLIIDNLYSAEVDGTTVAEKNNIEVIVGIDRLIFPADLKSFILVLDFYESNLDYVLGTNYSGQLTGDGAYNIAADAAGHYYAVTTSDDPVACPVGTIIYDDGANVSTDTAIFNKTGADIASDIDSGKDVQPVRTVFLLEEVNTATKVASATSGIEIATRPWAQNEGSTRSECAGWTRLSRYVTINRDDDMADPAAELDPFDTNVKGTYRRHIEQITNNIQIYNSKPYAVSIMRKNTGVRFGDTIEMSRARHLKEYKRTWTNILMHGKKADYSESELNYKGATSGLFDYEMFPIKYVKHPLPVDAAGTVVTSGTVKGLTFKTWIEDLAKACKVAKQDAMYGSTTLMVGIDFINIISTTAALIGTQDTNVFGVRFEKMPTGNQTLGLDVYSYKSTYGELRFIHMPELDYLTTLKVPTHLFPSGRRSPRWTAIALDKNYISIQTRKGREEKIYGNLQSNDNPFVSIEGISGAHMLKLRYPMNHMVIDMTPNY